MISIDPSLILQIVNFIFLIIVLNIILFKPIRNMLRQRKDKVTGLEQNIETFERNTSEKDASYAAGIKQARVTGVSEKENILQAASKEEKMIIDRINAKAREDLEAVRDQISKDSNRVRATLEKEIGAFAEAIKQKILGRAV